MSSGKVIMQLKRIVLLVACCSPLLSAMPALSVELSPTEASPAELLLTEPLLTEPLLNEPAVKKSKSGICHSKGSRYYTRTKYYSGFDSMENCLKSGGRKPKQWMLGE